MNKDLEYKELSSKSKEEIMELFKTNEDGLNILLISKYKCFSS